MSVSHIVEELKKNITSFEKQVDVEEVGTVIAIGDGIARLSGLSKCKASEMLEFPGGTMGVALNLEAESVGAVLFGECDKQTKLCRCIYNCFSNFIYVCYKFKTNAIDW